MTIARILKNPLFGFLLLGSVLFLLDSLAGSDRQSIVVSVAQQQRLAALWETQTGSVVTPEQLDSLVKNWVEEEVLYREALRLGLDHEDSIVRRRLIQKLGFIAESNSSTTKPDLTLENYYQKNIQNYTLPERYTFEQLYFESEADATVALLSINRGDSSSELGEPSMLNSRYAFRSALEIDTTFGSRFAEKIAGIAVDLWQGPFSSGLGFHLIQIITVHPEEVTPLAAIQDRVEMDFQRSQDELAKSEFITELADKYSITIEPR